MLNLNNYKIITTKKDFKKIIECGCIKCYQKSFTYYGNIQLFECNNCNSLYAINIEGVINILEINSGIIRVYSKNKVLIDDDEKEFEVEYKNINNLIKKRIKKSQR